MLYKSEQRELLFGNLSQIAVIGARISGVPSHDEWLQITSYTARLKNLEK